AGDAGQAALGATVFAAQCASCHGGTKWTKSTILWDMNPTFPTNPAAAQVEPFDKGLLAAGDSVAAPQTRDSLLSYTAHTNRAGLVDGGDETVKILEDVGTFDPMGAIEIRGLGALGKIANGASGFNVPALLGLGYTNPYFHDGSAATLPQVFA